MMKFQMIKLEAKRCLMKGLEQRQAHSAFELMAIHDEIVRNQIFHSLKASRKT